MDLILFAPIDINYKSQVKGAAQRPAHWAFGQLVECGSKEILIGLTSDKKSEFNSAELLALEYRNRWAILYLLESLGCISLETEAYQIEESFNSIKDHIAFADSIAFVLRSVMQIAKVKASRSRDFKPCSTLEILI